MDRNYIIGSVLLFLLLMGYMWVNQPSEETIARQKAIQDSIAVAKEQIDNNKIVESRTAVAYQQDTSLVQDSSSAVAVPTKEQTFKLKNDVLEITFSSIGGQIRDALLTNYKVMKLDSNRDQYKVPLHLLNNPKNEMGYELMTRDGRVLNTNRLPFSIVNSTDNSITMKASIGNGYIQQTYTLDGNDSYLLNCKVDVVNALAQGAKDVNFNLLNYANKLELNTDFEQSYSTIYYKETEAGSDHCACRGEDEVAITGKPIKWVSLANQFFNTSIIAQNRFNAADFKVLNATDDETLKIMDAQVSIPVENASNMSSNFSMYIGPNEYDRLAATAPGLEEVIPYGRSIFGAVNRWIIRPLFNLLSTIFSSKGVVILVLTFLVKALLFPLTYKMLHSQQKMAALKPVIAKLKDKYKDDSQTLQMEQMKLYREYGVSPAGGCWPMLLQMPIWFALYRFFPASIEFRQAPFLWANDLSNYDSFIQLPFDIPVLTSMMGSHISLFTLLWALSLLAYTYINNQQMDMTMANPMMKNMQYFMPLMFFFFLNKYASGLTCYLLFSNLLNIGQNLGTKKFLIDHDKIRAQLQKNKEKPKKKSKFRESLEKAMEEQRKKAEQQQQANKKTKK